MFYKPKANLVIHLIVPAATTVFSQTVPSIWLVSWSD